MFVKTDENVLFKNIDEVKNFCSHHSEYSSGAPGGSAADRESPQIKFISLLQYVKITLEAKDQAQMCDLLTYMNQSLQSQKDSIGMVLNVDRIGSIIDINALFRQNKTKRRNKELAE